MRSEPQPGDHLPILPDTLPIHGARKLLSDIGPLTELHALQVARLSLALFDGLSSFHGLGASTRAEVVCAALLHDIGVSVREEHHHKWTYALIMEKFWILDLPSRTRVALMGRYHRKALPKETHPEFEALDPVQRKAVWTGLACLRMADGLDRTHRALARDVFVRIYPRNLQISVQFSLEGAEEMAAAMKKSDGMEQLTNRKVTIIPFDVGCNSMTGTFGGY